MKRLSLILLLSYGLLAFERLTVGASSIVEDFENTTINPLLQSAGGYVFGPNANPVGTAQQVVVGDRKYISTIASDYNTVDFVYDLTITVNAGGASTPYNVRGIVYMGMGSPQPDPSWFTVPAPAVYLGAAPSDYSGGVLGLAIAPATGSRPTWTFPPPYPGNGTHRLRIAKSGDIVTFACQTNYSGGPFIPTLSTTKSLSQDLYFLNANNSRLWFGADTTARINELQITVFPYIPVILTQPTNLTAAAGSTASFTVAATGAGALSYQWRKNGANIAGATSATLTLNSVTAADSANYSVIVSNPYGSVTSTTASLSVLADGANGDQPAQTTAPYCPSPQTGKDSLVLITHGWTWANPDISWITNMANAIQAAGLPANWEVRPLDWSRVSGAAFPQLVLFEGEIGGLLYGSQLGQQQQWKNVHLIAHSAGAGVIESIALALKSSPNPPLIIQETFLDPYTGWLREGVDDYGSSADWADDYFVVDALTDYGGVALANSLYSTSGGLSWAYNVDIGGTVASTQLPVYYSGIANSTPAMISANTSPSHGSPIDFYMSTINGTAPICADTYGFPMSAEARGAGSWGSHPRNNTPYALCASLSLNRNPTRAQMAAMLDFTTQSVGTSGSGVNLIGGSGFSFTQPFAPLSNLRVSSTKSQTLAHTVKDNSSAKAKSTTVSSQASASATGTPLWLATAVTVTSTVNAVQFDASFTDGTAAEGLLTVYWNTNQVGMVDERVAAGSTQSYRFPLPAAVSSGLYTLSFRLDSFNDTTSSVVVSNVGTVFVGMKEPVAMGISPGTNGLPVLQLTGASNYNYLVQSSTNLVDWTPCGVLVNTNGVVQFVDPSATNSTRRFYRAVIPQ